MANIHLAKKKKQKNNKQCYLEQDFSNLSTILYEVKWHKHCIIFTQFFDTFIVECCVSRNGVGVVLIQ